MRFQVLCEIRNNRADLAGCQVGNPIPVVFLVLGFFVGLPGIFFLLFFLGVGGEAHPCTTEDRGQDDTGYAHAQYMHLRLAGNQ